MAYINVIMYSKVLPTYHSKKDRKRADNDDEVVSVKDPDKWNETLKKLKNG